MSLLLRKGVLRADPVLCKLCWIQALPSLSMQKGPFSRKSTDQNTVTDLWPTPASQRDAAERGRKATRRILQLAKYSIMPERETGRCNEVQQQKEVEEDTCCFCYCRKCLPKFLGRGTLHLEQQVW